MAVDGKRRRYKFGKKRDKRVTAELSARLAPLEEQKSPDETHQSMPPDTATAGDDTIRIDSTKLKVAEKFIEGEREGADIFRLHPVVVFILAAALAFVAFIAWQITLMPAK